MGPAVPSEGGLSRALRISVWLGLLTQQVILRSTPGVGV